MKLRKLPLSLVQINTMDYAIEMVDIEDPRVWELTVFAADLKCAIDKLLERIVGLSLLTKEPVVYVRNDFIAVGMVVTYTGTPEMLVKLSKIRLCTLR